MLLLALAGAACTEAHGAELPEDPAGLLRLLAGEDFDLRQAASERLGKLGEAARPELERAALSDVPEIRNTARTLLRKLNTAVLLYQVYDRDGTALPGMEFTARIYSTNQQTLRMDNNSFPVVSGPDGRFAQAQLPPGAISHSIEWDKLLPSRTRIVPYQLWLQRGTNPLPVVLLKGATLSGRVTDPEGKPVKEAMLKLLPQRGTDPELLPWVLAQMEANERRAPSTQSGADGVLTLEGVGEEQYFAVFTAEGYATKVSELPTLREGRSHALGDVALTPVKPGKVELVLVRREFQKAKDDPKKDGAEPKGKDKKAGKGAIKDPEEIKGAIAIAVGEGLGAVEGIKIGVAPADKPAAKGEGKDKEPGKEGAESEEPDEKGRLARNVDVQVLLEPVFEGPRAGQLRDALRAIWSERGRMEGGEGHKSDGAGKLSLEVQRPGRYRIVVKSGNSAPWILEQVDVASGATVALGDVQNVDAGSIAGRFVDGEGQPLQYINVAAVPEEIVLAGDPLAWNYSDGGLGAQVQSNRDGTFTLEKLPPGRYTLVGQTRRGVPLRWFGVEVGAGQAVNLKDIKLPGDIQVTNNSGRELKGTIRLADGKPASNANVTLVSPNNGRWGRSTNDKGEFSFNIQNDQAWQPTQLLVRVPFHRPCKVELTAADLAKKELTVQLEKQTYGSLKVRCVDNAGQPLEGVQVAVRNARNRYGNQPEKRWQTNALGECRISGLAAGPRTLTLEKAGYFVSGTQTVNVVADLETETVLTLRAGIALRGRVELPPGVPRETVAVALNAANLGTRTSALDENNGFAFDGLMPGKLTLTLLGPRVTLREPFKLELSETGEAPPSPVLAAQPVAGLALELAPALAGSSVLLRAPQGEAEKDGGTEARWKRGVLASGTVGSDGRVEFWDLPPGPLEADVVPAQRRSPAVMRGRYYGGMMTGMRRSGVTAAAGTVEAKVLPKASALAELAGTKLAPPTGSASVSGTLRIANLPPGNAGSNSGYITVGLYGSVAGGSTGFSVPSDFVANNGQQQAEPVLLGQIPAQIKERTLKAGEFQFQNVPDGNYMLVCEVRVNPVYTATMGMSARVTLQTAEQQAERLAAMPVTVKGGDVTLGEIAVTLPQSLVDRSRRNDDPYLDMEPEDLIPVFQP